LLALLLKGSIRLHFEVFRELYDDRRLTKLLLGVFDDDELSATLISLNSFDVDFELESELLSAYDHLLSA
jgi:hypothetical protein